MKKYLIFTVIIAAVIAIGIFLPLLPVKKTFYIKNSFPYAATAIKNLRAVKNVEFGNLEDTIIPSILKAPKNLTENLAGVLAQEMISKNSEPKAGELLPGPGVSMPNPSQIAKDYIANGLKTANENISNIAPIQLTISQDNSKDAVAFYLSQFQAVIGDNLDTKKIDLAVILAELNAKNGEGYAEKLSPAVVAHEAAASQLEKIPVPADLKSLATEEIRLLRITANIFKAIINVENDPLATMTAIQQLGAVTKNWQDLQQKFNAFIQKSNRT